MISIHSSSVRGSALFFLLGLYVLTPLAHSEDIIRVADSALAESVPEYPPLQQYSEISSRPLFNPDRKPRHQSAQSGGGNAQQLRENWRLTGVMITAEQLMALFSERNGSKRLRIKEGLPLDDSWQLEQVTKDGVTLVSGEESVWLELHQPRLPLIKDTPDQARSSKSARNTEAVNTSRPNNSGNKSDSPGGKVQTM
ncbi:DNA utilization family protein [Amphritea balenae]|uniref:DUF2531 family protein n=1 Tax=Amphritea balenae TaxID=452629 RepID=A0A3P1SHM8_9GAMM|nr:DNA utilization family protein [Amphritea balenae]RRC96793.1 DUF2531 family protein [Amphritea balenae]GGK84894.1 hypothetical protein GCM10007941_39270 [Amphritea balenae]